MRSTSVSGAASRSASVRAARRRHREVDAGEQRALARAAQRARQFEIGARGRVDFHRRAAREAHGLAQGRARADLRALDIADRQRRRGDLGAGERAKSIERAHAEEIRQAPFGADLRGRRARRRDGHAGFVQHAPRLPVVEDRVRRDDLGRLDARDLARDSLGASFREREGARGNVRGGEAIGPCLVGRAHAGERQKDVGAAGLQQPLLGDRAGRDEPHDVAPDHGLRAALARFGGILDLLAHGHAMAEPDQPLQIIVRALDRHAAHGDVRALVLAALGQHDAERPAGDFGVLEEQLVEIAHAVEQEAVRVCRLDLHVLRHHGRDAAGIRAAPGRRAGGRLRTRVEDGHGASLPERPRRSQRRGAAIPRWRRRGRRSLQCSLPGHILEKIVVSTASSPSPPSSGFRPRFIM